MRSPVIFVALFASCLVSALPVRRQAAANSSDLLVLKFANVLEQLETAFYTQALSKFQNSDFVNAGFSSPDIAIQQFQNIMSDESTHTTVLESTIQALGDTAISGCTFDFSSVLTDVSTMVATARLIENVGVGAYIGAAHLLSDPSVLTAAATIVTVESRHQSILNVLNAATAIPNAFDLALLPQEVLAIAGGFISGCQTGIQALPALQITNTGTVSTGTSLTFSSDAITSDLDPNTLSCQMMTGGMPFSLSLPYTACIVPPNLNGPVAIWVTNDSQPLNNNARDQFLGDIVSGPVMTFLDIQPEALGQAVRSETGASATASSPSSSSASPSSSSSASSSSSSTSSSSSSGSPTSSSGSVDPITVATTTISPAEASSIAESASAAAASATSISSGSAGSASPSQPGGPNMATGPSADGSIDVLGWSNLPPASS